MWQIVVQKRERGRQHKTQTDNVIHSDIEVASFFMSYYLLLFVGKTESNFISSANTPRLRNCGVKMHLSCGRRAAGAAVSCLLKYPLARTSRRNNRKP